MRIYVAGPYTAPTAEGKLENTNRAIDAGIELIKRGHSPFVPHLTHFIDERATAQGYDIPWEKWMELDFGELDVSDALLFLAPSRGALMELERAQSRGIPIYRSIADVPDPGQHA
jgi:2'-5' RNA ligase